MRCYCFVHNDYFDLLLLTHKSALHNLLEVHDDGNQYLFQAQSGVLDIDDDDILFNYLGLGFSCCSLYIVHFSFHRDTSLRDLRANSGDLPRIGSCNENLNSLANRDRETDFIQQNGKDYSGGEAPCFQSGVLRTNCIDCLDRTNVAQYAYGLAALGRQLHAMGLTDMPKVDPDSTIASALMDMYQSMGDALAQQYGGSEAHNTVSCITSFLN